MKERPSVLSVLIADDHPLYRAGLRAVLAGTPDLELAGEATTVREAVGLALELRPVGHGDAIFGAAAARRLAAYFADAPDRPARVFPELTEREREVLELLASGRPNGQIARALHLSPKTVRNHVSAVLNKLGVTDRAQAAIKARDAGLGRDCAVGSLAA